jgi:hypothetical protein
MSLPRDCADLCSQGDLWELYVVCGAYLFSLSNCVQAGLEPEVAVVVAEAMRNGSKFSQCNMAWGGFPGARGSRCWKFDSGWYFIST